MLDKLVVSKNSTKENRRVGNFLITSFLTVASILSVGLVYSLFTYNLAMGTDELSISTLVAPVLETEAKPIPKKQESRPDKAVSNNQKTTIRTQNIRRIEENPSDVPDKVQVTASKAISRPADFFEIGEINSDVSSNSGSSNVRGTNNNSPSVGLADDGSGVVEPEVIKVVKPKISEPPVLKEQPKPAKQTLPISGGVVNGKAVNLVQPSYSATAKSMGVSGKVTVQVLINEDGNVISAKAIDGHPLLRQTSVDAARKSKFSSTYLTDQKVKVSGVIVYNFIR